MPARLDTPNERASVHLRPFAFSLVGVTETLDQHSFTSRNQLAAFGGTVMWRLVGVAVAVIGYTAGAAFELEMRRLALRNEIRGR
jgi:uncharacterized membrane protein YdjX (TVP38/TMEM64 family)